MVTEPKKNWSLYNMAQTKEKMLFLRLLSDVVDFMDIQYDYKGNGRPHIAMDDMLKCCCIKVFCNFSARRTMAELQLAYALGYIRQIPHFNSISNYLNDPSLTPYLHKLYTILALPLVGIENNFAADATGFSTLTKKDWLTCRLDHSEKKDFKKLHIITGVRTNIITSAKVTDGLRSDNPEFPGLVRHTSDNFRIREIYADAGYLSNDNCMSAFEAGALPYIMPKHNTRTIFNNRKSEAWKWMITLWKDNQETFLKHYHMRSNVESTFSMMKRKFLPYIRSKNTESQYNEILCKVVCHNASVLINSLFELDIKIDFGYQNQSLLL